MVFGKIINSADHNPRIIRTIDKLYGDKLDIKDKKFAVKVRDIHITERKNSIGFSVFGYEDKKKYPIYVSKKCCEYKPVDLLLIDEEEKGTMFLSKISTHSCMIMYYFVEEKVFVVIVYKLLEQQNH